MANNPRKFARSPLRQRRKRGGFTQSQKRLLLIVVLTCIADTGVYVGSTLIGGSRHNIGGYVSFAAITVITLIALVLIVKSYMRDKRLHRTSAKTLICASCDIIRGRANICVGCPRNPQAKARIRREQVPNTSPPALRRPEPTGRRTPVQR